MISTETKTATANLNAKLNFNIKLTVQEKLLLLSAIRANIKQQLEYAETFHGEHYAATSFENVGKVSNFNLSIFLHNIGTSSFCKAATLNPKLILLVYPE